MADEHWTTFLPIEGMVANAPMRAAIREIDEVITFLTQRRIGYETLMLERSLKEYGTQTTFRARNRARDAATVQYPEPTKEV